MMKIREQLDGKLFSQPFRPSPASDLDDGKLIAQLYSKMENCISVLSDMKSRKSYIFYGSVADRIGLQRRETEINSIWEDELLSRVYSKDLERKYRLEFQFFQLLKSVDPAHRADYLVTTKLRVRSRQGTDLVLMHRLMYISSSEDESIHLTLCLYNEMYQYFGFDIPEGVIVNTRTGEIIDSEKHKITEVLSDREKEILRLIKLGRRTKEIALQLSLSIFTVNRHRQNIYKKLNVSNAIEACRIADVTRLL